MCGARPHPVRQRRGAGAGWGSYVCLLTSPKRLPALLLPPDAAGAGGARGADSAASRGAAELPKLRALLRLGLGARSSGALAAAGGRVWEPHEGAPVLRRAGAGGRGWAPPDGLGSQGGVRWGRSAGLRGEGAGGGWLLGVCTEAGAAAASPLSPWTGFIAPGSSRRCRAAGVSPHVGSRPSPAPRTSPPRVQRPRPVRDPGEHCLLAGTCPLEGRVP